MADQNQRSEHNKESASTGFRCPSCGASCDDRIVYSQANLPVHSCLQPKSVKAALSIERRGLELVECVECGLVFNHRFDPSTQRFDGGYEETQAYSPTFSCFSDQLANDLIERWQPQGKTIIEIGCGKGDFLETLCRSGKCRGIGIDPAYEPGRRPPSSAVEFEQRLFSGSDIGRRADFLICRHTLEHIGPVHEFLELVARFCRAGGIQEVFFDVPDAGRITDEGAFWDVYYEHANYFTGDSLVQSFERAGFAVIETQRKFYGQYLGLYARPGKGAGNVAAYQEFATEFEADTDWQRLELEREHWQARLDKSQKPVVIWGAGSKGVSFLSATNFRGKVVAAVDINPHRQGKFMPGSGQPIIAPSELRQLQPSKVIVMNPAYVTEISSELERLGLSPDIESLGVVDRADNRSL